MNLDPAKGRRPVTLYALLGLMLVGISWSLSDLFRATPLLWALDPVKRPMWLGANLAAVLVATMLLAITKSRQALPAALTKLLLGTLSIVGTFLLLEGAFAFVVRSHSVGYALAAQEWTRRYGTVNELGYRDDYSRIREDSKKIVVLGDSIVFGSGIRDVEQRFSNLLEQRTPDRFQVLNVGMIGMDTLAEFQMLVRFPFQADIIVLSYCLNDIEGAAYRTRVRIPGITPYLDLPTPTRALATNSYLFNYVYWSLPHADVDDYEDFLEQAYAQPKLMEIHKRDLGKIIRYAEKRRIPLVAVVFPFLHDIQRSATITESIVGFLRSSGVPVLDLQQHLWEFKMDELIVNTNDVHPSVLVHEIVAEQLAAILKSHGYLR